MASGPELKTQRLTLRRWRRSDLRPLAALNADPLVREHLPGVITEADTNRFMARIETHFEENGYGLWAVEHGKTKDLIGFAGLQIPSFDAPFMPTVELGWRFASEHWGKGYATESARAALDFGFYEAGLDEIVSFTAPANQRSTRVMERLGMSHDPVDDFDHPAMAPGSPLQRHVLYRLTASRWAELNRR